MEKSGYLLSITKEETEHKLFYTLYEPETIKATLLIVHGMQEHSGRYADFARFLTTHGIAVVAYDHTGHGKTAQSYEEMGFFLGKNPREQVVLDAENVASYLEKKYPYVPHFVLGHSMGSFITRCLLQQAHTRFDGAIIVGTGGKIPGIKVGKALMSLLNLVAPKHKNRFINKAFSKASNSKFKKEGNFHHSNWLSVNEENRKAFLEDELCGVPFTHNGFNTLISLNIDATKRNWALPLSKKFPMLFVSGEHDPIGDFSKGVIKTVDNLKKDGFQNVSLKIYPNMRHEILNETNKQDVYDEILKWILLKTV